MLLCICDWPSQLSCLSSSVGRPSAYIVDRMSQVRVPPEAAHFSLKMTVLGELHCVVLPRECLGLIINFIHVLLQLLLEQA